MRATVKFLVRPRIPSLSKAQVRREETVEAGVALATEVGSARASEQCVGARSVIVGDRGGCQQITHQRASPRPALTST